MTINRKIFTKQRRQTTLQQRILDARHARLQLKKLKRRLPKIAKVGIYYDSFDELPTQPIIDWCQLLGYDVYLPVVGTLTNSDKRLRFSPIRTSKLRAVRTYNHALGMKQHKHNKKLWAEELDIIFCPLVAIDSSGTRMGMGGGYYDHTLAYLHKHRLKKPLKLGWCYDFQFITDGTQLLQRQPWDVPLDGVVTPSSLVWFNRYFDSNIHALKHNIMSSADGVEQHLQQLAQQEAYIPVSVLEEQELTGIVNDKRLAELLVHCDNFLAVFDDICDDVRY